MSNRAVELLVFIAVLFLVLSVSAPVSAKEFPNELYVYLAVDATQTRSLSKDPAFVETNPILGHSPSTNKIAKHFLASAALLRVTYMLPIGRQVVDVMKHFEAGYIVANCQSGVMCPTNSQQVDSTFMLRYATSW